MAKYKIVLDREKCMGDGNCVDLAPETFSIDEDDRSYVLNPGGNWPEYVLKAAKTCPADAITLFDAETGERVWPQEETREGT
jgi:ferredoxin